jgi:hypothetical protein
MYAVKFKSEENACVFYNVMNTVRHISRFNFIMTEFTKAGKFYVRFDTIRLKKSKHYCGNHAGPCQINPAFEKPHIKGKWLEGADWVAFNDMINDTLDFLQFDADVSSSTCKIRIGLMRCIEYIGEDGADFQRNGVYRNCLNVKVKTKYPNGTPGIDTWVLG